MNALKEAINTLELPSMTERLSSLYGQDAGMIAYEKKRFHRLLTRFGEIFGENQRPLLVSAPGRVELCGNHTDHNNGVVMAAAIHLDTVAAVTPRDDLLVCLNSEGYKPVRVDLSNLTPVKGEEGKPASIIRGIAAIMQREGYTIRGFNAAAASDVLSGSGMSSSAAFEVMVCTIFDALYNHMTVSPAQRACIAQEAENVFFGKPCGLMDQMASSVGGLVGIDFKAEPIVTPLQFDFSGKGYDIVVCSTASSHADLTDAYASIRTEMIDVAKCFDADVLREVDEETFWNHLSEVRRKTSDRAVLRAIHFFNENKLVEKLTEAVLKDDIDAVLAVLNASGQSSWMHLQNVYAFEKIQPVSVALAAAEHLLHGKGAFRVHGSGFAGTILCIVPTADRSAFVEGYEKEFGKGACRILSVRKEGAAVIL